MFYYVLLIEHVPVYALWYTQVVAFIVSL